MRRVGAGGIFAEGVCYVGHNCVNAGREESYEGAVIFSYWKDMKDEGGVQLGLSQRAGISSMDSKKVSVYKQLRCCCMLL